ncbi:hypothetical protein PLICRDRAFT_173981 [Plicaturopsis crispa FD-325 SS-3]|nr:hypothetical protein PLICRDRAFT_173981 [Plicaturopsis crispa FD-325 SS-3]
MVSTRAENASKTPGSIARPRTRRTSEQVAADKAEKKAQSDAAKAEEDAKVKRIADLREQLRIEEAGITTPILERVAPKRKQRAATATHTVEAQSNPPGIIDEVDFEGSEGTGGASVPPESEEEPVSTAVGQGISEDEEFSGDDSGDYEPESNRNKDGDSRDDSDGSEAGDAMDVDEDDPDSELLQNALRKNPRKGASYKKRTKKEAGKALRDQIESLMLPKVEELNDGHGIDSVRGDIVDRKRKTEDVDATERAKKDTKKVKKETLPSSTSASRGLKKNWRDIVGATAGSARNVSRSSASSRPALESSDDDAVKFGGFIEDDDGIAEREALKLEATKGGSKGKGKVGTSVKRETTQMDVKIERTEGSLRTGGRGMGNSHSKPAGRTSTTRFTNADLPLTHSGLQTWRSHFVPSFIAYAATFQTGGWNLRAVPTLIDDVQKIWNAIFPDVSHEISWTGPVLSIAVQRGGYELHGLLKDAAVAAVKTHWLSDSLYSTPEERAKYVKYALGPDEGSSGPKFRPLMWLDAERSKGTFRSELVLRTFAVYLNAAQKSIADFGPPIGALCVSTAAVERALRIWASGNLDDAESKKDFSEGRWSKAALQYVSKARKLTDSKWERLITDAQVFTKTTRASDGPVDSAAYEDTDPLNDDDDGVSVSSTSDQE